MPAGGGHVESEDAGERGDERHDPGAAAEVAPDVCAQSREPHSHRHQPHDLPEHRPRGITRDRVAPRDGAPYAGAGASVSLGSLLISVMSISLTG